MDDKVRTRVGRYREGACGGLLEFLEYFTRFWGVATAIAMTLYIIDVFVKSIRLPYARRDFTASSTKIDVNVCDYQHFPIPNCDNSTTTRRSSNMVYFDSGASVVFSDSNDDFLDSVDSRPLVLTISLLGSASVYIDRESISLARETVKSALFEYSLPVRGSRAEVDFTVKFTALKSRVVADNSRIVTAIIAKKKINSRDYDDEDSCSSCSSEDDSEGHCGESCRICVSCHRLHECRAMSFNTKSLCEVCKAFIGENVPNNEKTITEDSVMNELATRLEKIDTDDKVVEKETVQKKIVAEDNMVNGLADDKKVEEEKESVKIAKTPREKEQLSPQPGTSKKVTKLKSKSKLALPKKSNGIRRKKSRLM